jgi:hypothetical protein
MSTIRRQVSFTLDDDVIVDFDDNVISIESGNAAGVADLADGD